MSFDIWNSFVSGVFQYAVDAFDKLEPYTYPLLFIGILGWVYTATHSVTAFIVGIMVTLGVYGATISIFKDVPELGSLLYIVTLVGLGGLFISMLEKTKGRR